MDGRFDALVKNLSFPFPRDDRAAKTVSDERRAIWD